MLKIKENIKLNILRKSRIGLYILSFITLILVTGESEYLSVYLGLFGLLGLNMFLIYKINNILGESEEEC